MPDLISNGLTVTRERIWGQYRRPNEPVLVKLPADPESMPKYKAKGFTFIKYVDEGCPIAIVDTSPEVLAKIALPSEPQLNTEPETYIAEKPYKSKRKPKRKYTRRS
jgi:hypothetical protein